MRSSFLTAPAEESWYRGIPLPQRGIGQPPLPRGIDHQDLFELALDRPTVPQRRDDAEGFGQPSHVGSQPEVALRTIAGEANRAFPRVHAALERAPPALLRLMRAEPVAGSRKFPGGLDVDAGALRPQVGRAGCARQILAPSIQLVGIDVAARLGRERADDETCQSERAEQGNRAVHRDRTDGWVLICRSSTTRRSFLP